jgi:hypothetical protein
MDGMFHMPHNVPTRMTKGVKGTKITVHNNKRKIPIVFRYAIKRNDRLFTNFILIFLLRCLQDFGYLVVRRVPSYDNLVKRAPHECARRCIEVALDALLSHADHADVAKDGGVYPYFFDANKKLEAFADGLFDLVG